MGESEVINYMPLALPDESQFRMDIQAINRFQQVVHSTMVENLDYGIIPGTQKPTLLKPGAEKIAKLLGLSDQYEIMDKAEDWQQPLFRYLIKCRLVHIASGAVIAEGLGECNSMESKYRWRWVGERDLPAGIDKSKLVSQERRSKTGGHWTVYRLDNEDIYSQVNTILKMSKKRALVDAALSAGRLSDVFTQDIEDMGTVMPEYTTESAADRARKEPSPVAENQDGAITTGVKTEKPEDETVEQVPEKPLRDPSTIKNITELFKACHEDFGMRTSKEVLAEAGYNSQADITEKPSDIYMRIAAVYSTSQD